MTWRRFLPWAVFALIVLPVIAIACIGYVRSHRDLTNAITARRQTVADLAALAMGEHFSHLADLAQSLANRQSLVSAIERGRWRDAAESITDVPRSFPYIDRVLLADPRGVERGSMPWVQSVIGVDFSMRDWYKGVAREWKPYVSEVYKRSAEPQYNVVAVGVPVRAQNREVIAILVLQIKADTFSEWTKELQSPDGGTLFFVDQYGHCIAHPDHPPQGAIHSFSGTLIVDKARRGERGVFLEHGFDGEQEDLAATAPVSGYGWGAIYAQPSVLAFLPRERQLSSLLVADGIVFLLACLGAFIFGGLLRRSEDAEASASDARTFLSGVLDNIPDMVFVKDAKDLRFVTFNRAGEELLGYARKDLIGKNDYDFFPREQAEFFTRKDRAALEASGVTEIPAEPIQTRQRGERYLHTKKVPIRDASGKPIYLLGISEDVTDRRLLERAKVDFVNTVSHQLRTPLSTMRWSLELLMEKCADASEAQRNLLRGMHEGLLWMGEVIQSMISASRIESHSLRPKMARVELRGIIEKIESRYRSFAKERQVAFSMSCPADLSLVTDYGFLEEILAHLVSNALRYTPAGGMVNIDARTHDGSCRITVRDTGIGVPEDEREIIFSKLYRGSNAVVVEPNGTGLGLFLSRALTNMLGGRITLETEVGVGTTFTVHLPMTT